MYRTLYQLKQDEIKNEYDKQEPYIKNFYWSCAPGREINKITGQEIIKSGGFLTPPLSFYGTINEWYQKLNDLIIESVNFSKERKGIAFHKNITTFIKSGFKTYSIVYKLEKFQKINDCCGVLNNEQIVYNDFALKDNIIVVDEHPNAVLIQCLDADLLCQ